ncbi:MAG: apolipoprotein N-acyltransferase [Elusimicrobia bacterium]|nr:apolipoprotein N-acyltransferase [Elusimicrobiota bacterium]
MAAPAISCKISPTEGKQIPQTRYYKPILACLASGCALALCLPKPGLTFLAWFAPAFLLDRLAQAKSVRKAFLLGWIFGSAFCGAALHWIYLTCRFAGVSAPVSALVLIALASFLGLNWGIFGALTRFVKERLSAWALPWVYAAALAAVESMSARFLDFRLAPDLLAYTQWRHPILLQGLSWAGPHALSFLILLCGGALLAAYRRERGAAVNLAVAGALLCGWCFWGALALASRAPRPSAASMLRVEILQPNIDQYRKWAEEYEGEIRRVFDGLLAEPRKDAPSLILWPESALPGWLDEPEISRWVSSWPLRTRAPMLVGSITRLGEREYNSAALFDERGRPAGLYHKRRLVPFGEFVPLRPLLEPYIGILAQLGNFSPGPLRQPLISTPLGPLAVSICYEAAFPRLLQLDAQRGARVFANLTNDGWYKDTWGPHQHFWVNAFRAVENRATVLRAANTGISGVIDPYGIVLARSELMKTERLDLTLSADNAFPEGSFYARHGDWFGALCMAASLLAVCLSLKRDNRRKIS